MLATDIAWTAILAWAAVTTCILVSKLQPAIILQRVTLGSH